MIFINYIRCAIVSVFTSSAVDREFESRAGQRKDYAICICCFLYAVLENKSKDWLARNQDNVSEWKDMITCRLLSVS